MKHFGASLPVCYHEASACIIGSQSCHLQSLASVLCRLLLLPIRQQENSNAKWGASGAPPCERSPPAAARAAAGGRPRARPAAFRAAPQTGACTARRWAAAGPPRAPAPPPAPAAASVTRRPAACAASPRAGSATKRTYAAEHTHAQALPILEMHCALSASDLAHLLRVVEVDKVTCVAARRRRPPACLRTRPAAPHPCCPPACRPPAQQQGPTSQAPL